MPIGKYLICIVSNQGFLKIKVNLKLTLMYKVFILQNYAMWTYTACNPNIETISLAYKYAILDI